jgi:hypothetical protein
MHDTTAKRRASAHCKVMVGIAASSDQLRRRRVLGGPRVKSQPGHQISLAPSGKQLARDASGPGRQMAVGLDDTHPDDGDA